MDARALQCFSSSPRINLAMSAEDWTAERLYAHLTILAQYMHSLKEDRGEGGCDTKDVPVAFDALDSYDDAVHAFRIFVDSKPSREDMRDALRRAEIALKQFRSAPVGKTALAMTFENPHFRRMVFQNVGYLDEEVGECPESRYARFPVYAREDVTAALRVTMTFFEEKPAIKDALQRALDAVGAVVDA